MERNPYTPGAGHPPPYLAGRQGEVDEFVTMLQQERILENVILTGLRGVGKTVLLEEKFKPTAIGQGWLWAGADLSESSSLTEETLATRLITDLSIAASSITTSTTRVGAGFGAKEEVVETFVLSYETLVRVYNEAPGLVADRLKAVLLFAWQHLQGRERNRVVFAYDEAQNLADHAKREQFPLSVLLEVFVSIQRQGVPFMLVLTGLPTLFPKLVEARTYAERMFHVFTLTRLTAEDSREAIQQPLVDTRSGVKFTDESVNLIVESAAGYPYFVQFICKEVFDIFMQQIAENGVAGSVPLPEIQQKLDTDFFAGRWGTVSDRQRDLLWVVAQLDTDEEFSIQEITSLSKTLSVKSFSSSQTNQMLGRLGEQGLIYKNRFGKYLFAVPLLGDFIRRTYVPSSDPEVTFS
jgi:hypothetical protein